MAVTKLPPMSAAEERAMAEIEANERKAVRPTIDTNRMRKPGEAGRPSVLERYARRGRRHTARRP